MVSQEQSTPHSGFYLDWKKKIGGEGGVWGDFAEYVRNIHVDSNYHFVSVETSFTWKASITSSSVIFSEDSFLHEGFHHENEPGCFRLGRCFSRPYF